MQKRNNFNHPHIIPHAISDLPMIVSCYHQKGPINDLNHILAVSLYLSRLESIQYLKPLSWKKA